MPNVLAIIPARGGSKELKGKNLKELDGHPLVSWSLVQAIEELGENNVIVSTDNTDIYSAAARYGHKFNYMRPKILARDNSPTEPCMIHALEWYVKYHQEPKYIMLLQPTSPLRKKNRLKEVIQFTENGGFDSTLSVCKTHSFFWKGEKNPTPSYDFNNRPRRQDITKQEKLYKETGSIYVTKTKILRETKNRLGGNIGIFEMDPIESYEIDTQLDFSVLDAIWGSKNELNTKYSAA